MNRINLNHTAVAVAVAAAFSAVSGSAFAYSFTDGGYTAANTAEVKIAGSSATNNQLKAWAQGVLCDATKQVTLNSTVDTNNFAVVCTPKPGAVALPAGKTQIAVLKNSSGGSGNGVAKLVSTQQYLNVFQANPASGALGAATVADIGMSDEEPEILDKAGAISGGIPGGLISTPLNVVTFGTPVTLPLYRALQDSQIASGKLAASCHSGAVYNDGEACMPSLSQSQIASIFGGNLVGWSELGLHPADDQVYVARRVITSGTQTASRMFFLNDPCAEGMVKFVDGDLGENGKKADACNAVSYSGRVFEGSGGGNVATCLTNHARNGRFAIGINSLELPSLTDTSDEYVAGGGAATGAKILNKDYQRHIKIDGFAPTTFNTATGRYRFWYEATMNTVGAPTGAAGSLQAAMVTGFNDPAVLVPLNSSFATTALLGAGKSAGILAPALAGTPAAVANESGVDGTTANPLMYYTHSISGTPNSCQPAMSYSATGINP